MALHGVCSASFSLFRNPIILMRFRFSFFSLLALGTLLSTATISASCSPMQARDGQPSAADSTQTITLLFAGDLMQHQSQIDGAKRKDGTYDYEECFRYIKDDISEADLAIANFEVTLAGPPYAGYPRFCAPDEYLDWSMNCGFDVLLTANNHSCDTGADGIRRTIEVMDEKHVPHLGTYKNQADRDANYPFIIEQNGFKFAFLNYTYATNGLPVPEPYIVNGFDRNQMAKDIAAAKAKEPDVIIAFMHWGIEYVLEQNREQEELAQWLLDQGVDHVVGDHPHVVQPAEIRTDSLGHKHLVCYSLGNFVSNITRPNTDGGMFIRLMLEKSPEGEVSVTDSDYSLFWVSRPPVSGHHQHRVYPISVPDSLLNAQERKLRNAFIEGARGTFTKNNKDIEERILPWRNIPIK